MNTFTDMIIYTMFLVIKHDPVAVSYIYNAYSGFVGALIPKG